MKLKFWKKPPVATTPEALAAELAACCARGEALVHATVALLACAKEFAFTLPGFDSAAFTRAVEATRVQVPSTATAAELRKGFDGTPERILAFIEAQKTYLDERERELKNIIDLLHQGLTILYDDNRKFTDHLRDRGLEMERIIELEDIRRIKEQLRGEIDAIRVTVAEKKASDLRQLDQLTREVDTLKKDLETMTDASFTDVLTHAHNRMAFDITMQRMIDRHAITGDRFCLLMCDLDNFKGINDSYGHLVGDRVLVSMVNEFRSLFREQDFIARFGGDEFAIILPSANLRDARRRGDTFCRHFAGKRFRVDKDRPEPTLIFTLSIGIGEMRVGDTAETLLSRADRALYLAKKRGKNQALSEQDVTRLEKQAPASAKNNVNVRQKPGHDERGDRQPSVTTKR